MRPDLPTPDAAISDVIQFCEAVKQSANGMLPLEIYTKLYDVGYRSRGGIFVEIGTAHGAATIALARGALDANKPFHIYTVDPFQGKYSSRTAFGSVENNIAFVQSQFEKFAVNEHITIVAGSCEDLIRQHPIANVCVLLLDADGRIDRDLSLLAGRTAPGCTIIIDDIDNAVQVARHDGYWLFDQKHRIGHLLAEQLMALGFLRKTYQIFNTGFFTKGDADLTSDEISRTCLPLYRELVFAEIQYDLSEPGEITAGRYTKAWFRRNAPFLFRQLKKAKKIVSVGQWTLRRIIKRLARRIMFDHRPRICILADKPGWSYDISARAIKRQLVKKFAITIRYSGDHRLDPSDYDILHVCSFAERGYQSFGFVPQQIIKEVSSHRWEDDPLYGPYRPDEFARHYLSDCDTVICTSKRLTGIVGTVFPRTYFAPNGFDSWRFTSRGRQLHPQLMFGWAGNADDPVKGFHDIILPALGERFSFTAAGGGLGHLEMGRFYRAIDIFVVASRNEGEPLTLIEAMASGCFPVCVDVGIVPELIQHGRNGYIVPERTIGAFQEAFEWCERNKELVHTAGAMNADYMARERNWAVCVAHHRSVYRDTLKWAERPKFRNDDVSWDTSLANFQTFCAVFRKYGLTQIHGLTLRGCTNVGNIYNGQEVEYAGFDSVAELDNAVIRWLSDDKRIENRPDLVEYLNLSEDEVALHGLYHTDYSVMSEKEQDRDIAEGLALMHRLFPAKRIRFFIAPFNRTNAATYSVAARYGLTVLANDGVHLEEQLHRLRLEPGQWYRYHHHRFYPDSHFRYYSLSIEKLDAALGRNFDSRGCILSAKGGTMGQMLRSAARASAARAWRSASHYRRQVRGVVRSLASVLPHR